MNIVIIGNIVSFIGSLIMISVGLMKTKRQILIMQNLQFAVMTASNLILGGVTGALSNVVGIVRNIVSSRVCFSTRWKLLFIAIQGILTIVVNKAGLLGWFPFIAAAAFTWFLDTRNERVLKGAIIFGELLWIVYDLSNRNYAGLVFDVITVFSNIAGIILITRDVRLADRRARG